MIFAGYVKVAPGKPQTGWVKLKISPGTGKAKFSLGEGKISTESGFTGSVTEGCNASSGGGQRQRRNPVPFSLFPFCCYFMFCFIL